jgi:predicted nucleotide-binding protein
MTTITSVLGMFNIFTISSVVICNIFCTEWCLRMENLTIQNILRLVGNTYNSIDIRAILARPKSESNAEWTCVFLKVRLTNEDRAKLKKIHLAKKNIEKINKPFFRVDLVDIDIKEIDSILAQLTSGYITIGEMEGYSTNLPNTRWKDILSQTASKSNMYSTDEERAGNIHLLISSTMELSIAGQIRKLGLTEDQIGLQISQLHQWCDTTNLDDGNINNIILLFPIYCRQSTIMKSQPNNVIAKYEIHNLLINGCTAKIVDENDRSILKKIALSNINKVQSTNSDTGKVELAISNTILEKRLAKIQIWHNDLGLVREDSINTDKDLGKSHDLKIPMDQRSFYHVKVQRSVLMTSQKINFDYEINLTKDQIINYFVMPFNSNKKIICNGNVFEASEITAFKIYFTREKLEKTDRMKLDSKIHSNAKDVTREFLEESQKSVLKEKNIVNSKQVFIVHGHHLESKLELARLIEKDFNLEAIILHEQADEGRTIIEKLESFSERPGYAFVILTPDDIGGENPEGMSINILNNTNLKLKDLKIDFKNRARQNVVLELGYFLGISGRSRVCCLYKGEIELPSDMSGILYLKFDKNVNEKYKEIRRELKAAGYNV